jgi:hypothetical protein
MKRKTGASTNEAAALMRLRSNVQCGTWKQTSFSLFSPIIYWFNTNQ